MTSEDEYDDGEETRVRKPEKYLEDEITYSYWQLALMIFLSMFMCYVIYEYEYMHILALRFYANMGDQDSQHILGQRYYMGRGVPRDKKAAFYWFKEAAKQGHGHASYNLALAHLQGFHRLERKGEARELLQQAANLGIKEADELMKDACSKGECDR